MHFCADNHIHTKFSPDGYDEPESFVRRAMEAGARHICFTEHVDLLYHRPEVAKGDIDGYFACVRALQRRYADKIYIGAGLEMGYTAANARENARFLSEYRPDYIINSVHEVDGCDCYFPEYFNGKSKREAYAAYLRAVDESLDAPYAFDTVGHLGYVCRNAPFDTCDFYAEMREEINAILRKIIAKQKILELNTGVRGVRDNTVPVREIFLQYVALGGKKVCFASDAHRPQDAGRNYAAARTLAREAGISVQTVVENGREKEIEF